VDAIIGVLNGYWLLLIGIIWLMVLAAAAFVIEVLEED
jgi:hypothetical protein